MCVCCSLCAGPHVPLHGAHRHVPLLPWMIMLVVMLIRVWYSISRSSAWYSACLRRTGVRSCKPHASIGYTLLCAAMTVFFWLVSHWAETDWQFNYDNPPHLQYVSAFFIGALFATDFSPVATLYTLQSTHTLSSLSCGRSHAVLLSALVCFASLVTYCTYTLRIHI